jgi:hypothetical protein
MTKLTPILQHILFPFCFLYIRVFFLQKETFFEEKKNVKNGHVLFHIAIFVTQKTLKTKISASELSICGNLV